MTSKEFNFTNECIYYVVLPLTDPTIGIVMWINNSSELTQ